MRYYFVILFAILALEACSSAPVTRNEGPAASPTQANVSQKQTTSIEPIQQFLLTSAATDFHKHGPAGPLSFRNVRVGHVMNAKGEEQYLLCGQFQQTKGAKAEWSPFATIKTSGYEQWLGDQAEGFCKNVKWDTEADLSSSLQNQIDSLQ